MSPGDLVILEDASGIPEAEVPVYYVSGGYLPSGRESVFELSTRLEALKYMKPGSAGVLLSLHYKGEGRLAGESPHWGRVFFENSVGYVGFENLIPVSPV